MAGLNFQTCTIINSNVDPDSKKPLFVGTSGVLKVKRDFIFYKGDVDASKGKVLSVMKKAGYEPEMCQVTINFENILTALKDVKTNVVPKTYCRLDVYLGVEGAEPYIYSTPWVAKGMPFWIDFTIESANITSGATEAATALAKQLKADIEKIHMFQCDKDLVTVEASGGKLILHGANEFLRFKNVEVVKYHATEDSEESLAKLVVKKFNGKEQSNTSEYSTATIKEDNRGYNGFGTYSQIIKDLRLPTAANYQWTHIRQAETPIVGAVYDQYIINYEAPATNDGLGAVGQRMNSVTTHVFWVKSDVSASDWNTALTNSTFKVTEVEGPTEVSMLTTASAKSAKVSSLN